MKELETLLKNRWILKSRDKEMYYRLRDSLGSLRKFVTEKLGCQIIENSILIKMEKIPVVPEGFMDIRDLSSKEEYAYLCMLLMFLEDKDAQEQFILSQLTEYLAANMPGELSDWTLYTNRRKLIRVLRYAVKEDIIGLTDGRDDSFMDDKSGEVLYENTGSSRYFMRNFSRDIMEYKELLDLLIQLRTPKLSKDFKPSVINDILSDSLQALSDEDLRPMSEAIENMDTMNMNLKSRKEARQAAEKISDCTKIIAIL